jgi:hypothetical protein
MIAQVQEKQTYSPTVLFYEDPFKPAVPIEDWEVL